MCSAFYFFEKSFFLKHSRVHLLIVDGGTLVEDKDGGTLVDRPNQLTLTWQMNTAGKSAWGSLN